MGKVKRIDPCVFQGKSDMVSQLQPLIVIVFSHMYVILIEDIKGGKTYIGNRLRLVGEVHISPDGCFTCTPHTFINPHRPLYTSTNFYTPQQKSVEVYKGLWGFIKVCGGV